MSQRKQGDAPPLPDDLAGVLLDALESIPLADDRREAVRQRLMARIAASAPGIVTIRAAEGEWRDYIPGVEAKTLHGDGRSMTWLARLAPGARVPAHVHEDDEEILILEGACTLGGRPMSCGDFERSESGTHHAEMFSAGGCLLLVRTLAPQAGAMRS